jgi:hypothetical protein
MKNSIKLTALFLVLSAGFFAATSAKADGLVVPSTKDAITFSSLPSNKGLEVKVDGATSEKAIVLIYDKDGNVLRKDVLSASKAFSKAYILNQLENGDYTIEVTSNKQVIKKDIHVYDEDNTRMFIVKE